MTTNELVIPDAPPCGARHHARPWFACTLPTGHGPVPDPEGVDCSHAAPDDGEWWDVPVCGAPHTMHPTETCTEPAGHGPIPAPSGSPFPGTEYAHARRAVGSFWGEPTADQRAHAAAPSGIPPTVAAIRAAAARLTPAEVADQRPRAAWEAPCSNAACSFVRAHRGPCAVPLDAPSSAVERGALAVLERWPSAASIARAPAVDIVAVALAGALSDVDALAGTLAAAVAPDGMDPADLHGAACDVPGGCYAHDQARALVASIVGTGDGQ
ncbi:hypothetical protein ACFCZ3_20075 [Cellulosimicrobium cellulans]|uniref:hypothetical protein n=1 Tax=Cellulosimicrobium cellulans TaxID=1710 RepID=UPI0035DB309E